MVPTSVPDAARAAHTFTNDGVYPVEVTLGDLVVATTTVTVRTFAPLVAAGPDWSILEGARILASGSFRDPGADQWTATVVYGDGSLEQPLTLQADKTFVLDHVYADNGSYTVTVRVRGNDMAEGTWSQDTLIVRVSNVAPEAAITGCRSVPWRERRSRRAAR